MKPDGSDVKGAGATRIGISVLNRRYDNETSSMLFPPSRLPKIQQGTRLTNSKTLEIFSQVALKNTIPNENQGLHK